MAPSKKQQELHSDEFGDPRPTDEPSSRQIASSLFHNATALVTYIREARKLRNEFFDPDLFGEPGWDILLDLYRAELGQERLAISSIGLSSGTAPTTTIRWLNTLESKGLIRREPDPLDARRIFASLTGETVRVLDAMFADLWERLPELQRAR